MSVIIRPARANEIPRLQEIEREAAIRFRDVGLDAIADGDPNDEAFILALMKSGEVLGAESEGALVGFVLAGRLDDALHIYEISVAPSHGGRGIGGALLDAIADRAHHRGVRALSLSTFADVAWNAPFYARRGFALVEERAWTPAFFALRAVERAAGLSLERRIFMRKELA